MPTRPTPAPPTLHSQLFALVATTVLVAACAGPRASENAAVRRSPRLALSPRFALPSEAEPRPLPDLTAEGAGLPELLRYAHQNNPGLAAAFERWLASAQRSTQAASLPDPMLRFTGYLEEVETRVGPMDAKLGLSQAFPWFGTLSAAGRRADREAAAALARLEAARFDLEARVRVDWYEYAWLEEAIAVTRGHRELIVHLESVARSRLEVGIGSHADVLRAQVELGKIEDRLRSLEDLRRPTVARLNASLGRATDAPLPRPTGELPTPPAFDTATLLQGLRETSPVLLALAEQVRAAEEGVALAQKGFWPSLSVGADAVFIGSAVNPNTPGSGDDALSLTVGLTLPIQRGAKHARLVETRAELRGARASLEDAEHQLAAKLEQALYRVRDGDRRAHLFQESLIPKGEESLESLDIGYQAGDEEFDDLIDAERVLLEFQLQAVRAEADRAQALAEVERLAGVRLTAGNND